MRHCSAWARDLCAWNRQDTLTLILSILGTLAHVQLERFFVIDDEIPKRFQDPQVVLAELSVPALKGVRCVQPGPVAGQTEGNR